MELKDFIASTLANIAEGVKMAPEQALGIDARINPYVGSGRYRGCRIVRVEFNVAISETQGTGTKGSIGVLAGWIGAKSSGESRSDSAAATSIKFSVPMILPTESDTSKHPK